MSPLQTEGWCHLEGLVPAATCEAITAAWREEVAPTQAPLLRQLSGAMQPHLRSADGLVVNPVARPHLLPQFPRFCQSELAVMKSSELVPTVAALLGELPAMLQSAYYESSRGTAPHVDLNPLQRGAPMLGVWIALEDIGEQAGRFFVYPGSHRLEQDEAWHRFAELSWARYRDGVVDFTAVDEADAEAQALLAGLVRAHDLRLHTPAMRQGDGLIWHAHTVHGSHAPTPGGGSRSSLLLHFVGRELAGARASLHHPG